MAAEIVMAIIITALAVQVARDFGQQKWLVGAVIGILTVWVALESALAWRRGNSTA
jgi:hypothetical protein